MFSCLVGQLSWSYYNDYYCWWLEYNRKIYLDVYMYTGPNLCNIEWKLNLLERRTKIVTDKNPWFNELHDKLWITVINDWGKITIIIAQLERDKALGGCILSSSNIDAEKTSGKESPQITRDGKDAKPLMSCSVFYICPRHRTEGVEQEGGESQSWVCDEAVPRDSKTGWRRT